MIVLVRHAQTDQAKGRCVGRTDVALSAEGAVQAARLAGSLADAGFVRLCTSPAKRALNTLAPLATRLDREAEIIPELNEIDMGEWDGLFFDDIRDRFPAAYAERGSRFGDFRPPGGESFNDVADRAMHALARLVVGPKPVLAVTHAGVIRSVLCRVTGHPMDDLFHFGPGHGLCTILAPAWKGLELVADAVEPGDVASYLSV